MPVGCGGDRHPSGLGRRRCDSGSTGDRRSAVSRFRRLRQLRRRRGSRPANGRFRTGPGRGRCHRGKVGDLVKSGQVLARIDARAAEQNVAASDALVRSARATPGSCDQGIRPPATALRKEIYQPSRPRPRRSAITRRRRPRFRRSLRRRGRRVPNPAFSSSRRPMAAWSPRFQSCSATWRCRVARW